MEHRPWIGEKFSEGLEGQRLLICGYSHHGLPDAEDFTQNTVRNWALTKKASFFNRILSYFDNEDPHDFWQSVAFANILPTSVGEDDQRYANGTSAQVAAIAPRWTRLLNDVAPDKAIVFTRKGWRRLPPFDGQSQEAVIGVPDFEEIEYGGYARTAGEVLTFGLKHPQFSTTEGMRRSVRAILDFGN